LKKSEKGSYRKCPGWFYVQLKAHFVAALTSKVSREAWKVEEVSGVVIEVEIRDTT